MLRLFDSIRRAAPLNAPVIIQGPTGSGKELVAQALHALSGRRGSVVAVNVGAIPEALAEGELFGVARGAYTGAVRDRRGLIEAANGGTLFLDEGAELSIQMQIRLLRALEYGTFRPVGCSTDRHVNVRLVVSVQESVSELVGSKRWREDFFYRVTGLVLSVPALIDRPTDISLLVDHWLEHLGLAPLAGLGCQELAAYEWPGNIRELQRAVERAVFEVRDRPVAARDILEAALLSAASAGRKREPVPSAHLRDIEKDHIQAVLRDAGYNTKQAAIRLGIPLRQLYRRFKTLGITPPRRR